MPALWTRRFTCCRDHLSRWSCALALTLVLLPGCARASDSSTTLTTCGARIDVEFRGESESVSRNDLLHWINAAAAAVCDYYGEFPVRHFSLLVKVDGRPGVHSGMTFPRGGGFTRISVGPQTTVADLKKDWMMTHEMIHLAFPSMADSPTSSRWHGYRQANYPLPTCGATWSATCRRANHNRVIVVWTKPIPGAAPTGVEHSSACLPMCRSGSRRAIAWDFRMHCGLFCAKAE